LSLEKVGAENQLTITQMCAEILFSAFSCSFFLFFLQKADKVVFFPFFKVKLLNQRRKLAILSLFALIFTLPK